MLTALSGENAELTVHTEGNKLFEDLHSNELHNINDHDTRRNNKCMYKCFTLEIDFEFIEDMTSRISDCFFEALQEPGSTPSVC